MMTKEEIRTATREQLTAELAAACAYTEDYLTATMDDLRERVRRLVDVYSGPDDGAKEPPTRRGRPPESADRIYDGL